MGKRNAIEMQPPEVRMMIREELYHSGFSDYTGLADELNAKGYAISRSALHRYGQRLQAEISQAEIEKLLIG